MGRRIAIIQGHPDPQAGHLCNALADAYHQGALQAGHDVRLIEVTQLDFPLLRSQRDYEQGQPPADIAQAQQTILWAEHLVILYPLWAGGMPALLKAFLEQLLRPGFAYVKQRADAVPKKMLTGRSARIVITMGMPTLVYRWFYRAHSLKSLKRNILKLCGISPIRETLFGMVENVGDAKRRQWLDKIQQLGRTGS
ncbi:MAG: NAD(P)H-dependent oxidoreductase [Chromatiales bacterium]|jgi:putative NADPH-quinone reductase